MSKTRLKTFGNGFRLFCNFEKFSIFLKNFDNSTLQGLMSKKTFSEKSPQNMFKTRLDTFGNDFGHFCNFEKFLIFVKIFEDSTLHGTLGKKTFEKITPKNVQNTFGQLWERFWVCLKFWKIFDFFENYRRLDPPWNTGQKNFSKKLTQNKFKSRLDTFGNDFGHFWNFESFWFFWKFSTTRASMEHWAKKFFEKIKAKHVQNTFEDFWERF